MAVLGIDLGGTKIAGGVVDERANLRQSLMVPTQAERGYEVSIAQLYTVIEQLLSSEISAIGICAPGPLNPKTGVVINPPNLPGWRDIPLAEQVRRKFNLPCHVENDANAAGLAEACFGAARGYASVFYVTLGTGVGSGIILDGKVYHGRNGAAAEGGHVTIDYRSGAECNCGSRGCIEALSSGSAMARRAQALLHEYPDTMLAAPVDAESIGMAAAQGDPLAIRILDESAIMLGAWLGSMISILDPGVIVIGGGVARIGEPLFSRLRKIAPTRTINQFAHEVPIVPAGLGPHAGILGAAAATGVLSRFV